MFREAGLVAGFAFLCLWAGLGQAAQNRIWWSLDSFAHAQPVSIAAYIDDWDDPRGSGDDAVAQAAFTLGWAWGAWSLAYVQHYRYEIAANGDSADLYHSARNRLDLPVARQYRLGVNAHHSRAQGIRIGHRWALSEAAWVESGLTILEGMDTLDGRVDGDATAVGAREYDFDATVDYVYREDALFDRPREAELSGRGLALDLAGQWSAGPWAVAGQIHNVFGFMDWRRAQFTRASATSDTRRFDDQGFVSFDPVLSGFEGVARHRQRLRPQAELSASRALGGRHRLGLWLRSSETLTHLAPSYAYQWGPTLAIGVRWLPRDHALGLTVDSRWGSFSLMADRLDSEDAHLLSVGIRQSFQWGG